MIPVRAMVHERSVVRPSGASLEKILEDLGYVEDLVHDMSRRPQILP
jgi:hypothetical protein